MKRALVLCAVVSVACGANKFTNPDVPDVSGAWRTTFSSEVIQVGGDYRASDSCQGTLTIRQSDAQLSGNFLCGGGSGEMRGTIRPDGGVSFSLTVPGRAPITPTADCPTVSADSQYNGVISGWTMQATKFVTIGCIRGITARINYRVDATR